MYVLVCGSELLLATVSHAVAGVAAVTFKQQTSILPLRSMTGLSQLLTFADAVGSGRALLRVCLSQLDELSAFVSLPAPKGQPAAAEWWEVGINTSCYWLLPDPDPLATADLFDTVGQKSILTISSDQQAVIAPQVAQQTEQLLYLAHKLQLPTLQQKLHVFLRNNTVDPDYLLYGHMCQVLTDRVLEVAADKQQLRELVINSILTERCGLHNSEQMHAAQVLEPLKLTAQQQQPLYFKAVLRRDAFGYSRGSTVDVALNLFGEEPSIRVNDVTHTAQLVVGSLVRDKQSLDALMGPPPAAAEHEA